MAFRLRAEIEGETHHFPLASGQTIVGTGRDSDLVLAVRGVSRRHGCLEVLPNEVRVRDLESKNGTRVDGRRLPAGVDVEVRAGSVLEFGPVTMELEAVEEEDAKLGLEVDTSSILDPERDSLLTEGSTWWSREGGVVGRRQLRAFEVVVERLFGLPEPDIEGALSGLADALEAEGVALVEWPGRTGPLVLAAAGALGETPPLEDFGRAGRGTQRSLLQPRLAAASWRDAEGTVGLVLWGDGAGDGSDELLAALLRLLRRFRPQGHLPSEEDAAPGKLVLPGSIVQGRSAPMVALYQQMEKLLEGDVPVLLLGETGVGKEHLARALHHSSDRAGGPFVAINCAAIPEQLLEAEMFGIGRGVASGVSARRGRFAEAHGGTLFLDEVGDMPAELQAKLLRAIQERVIQALGRAPEPVDVRIVAATNADLRRLATEGSFRLDLFYRLAGYELRVPALRERRDDIPQLVGFFLRRFCRQSRRRVRGVTVKALRLLGEYRWPGNV
ncbi:MAG: sigma 54-interacting transcriptional regulator, partial [Holophagales bacterium]|nr:sigma 54-interacting transcriptional regulator [Holophagales bacterium]